MALSKIDVANMLTGLVPNDNTIRRPNAKSAFNILAFFSFNIFDC